MNEILNFAFLVLLLLAGIYDLMHKKISLLSLTVGMILCVLQLLLTDNLNIIKRFTGTLIGLFMLYVSRISKESIGYGDGMLVVELGFMFGFQASLEIVFISFWLMFPFTCYFFASKLWKNNKDRENYRKNRTRENAGNEKINGEKETDKCFLEKELSVKIIRLPYIPFLMISYCIWLFHI